MEDFHQVVQYFGEDPKNITTTEFFGIFAEFIIKFEASIKHEIVYSFKHDQKCYHNSICSGKMFLYCLIYIRKDFLDLVSMTMTKAGEKWFWLQTGTIL
jgi:hypothetical protein